MNEPVLPTEQPDGAVRESARITVKPGREKDFEAAVAEAAALFRRARGARSFALERSHENPSAYRLTVDWESIDDHVTGFRGSADFGRWRELIGDLVAGTPEVEHFEHVLTGF
jgi:quinol monooxygenase YgiN